MYNTAMRWCFTVVFCFIAFSTELPLHAQSTPSAIAVPAVTQQENHPSKPSKRDLKAAEKAYHKGVEAVKHQNVELAFKFFSQAAALNPENRDYADSEELARQQLVKNLLAQADQQLVANDRAAADTLARVERIDPQNPMLLERMHQFTVSHAPPHITHDEAYGDTEITLEPKAGEQPF